MQATCVPATHLRFCWSFSVLMCQPRKLPGGWRSKGLERVPAPGPPPPQHGASLRALTQSLQGLLGGTGRGSWLINVDT